MLQGLNSGYGFDRLESRAFQAVPHGDFRRVRLPGIRDAKLKPVSVDAKKVVAVESRTAGAEMRFRIKGLKPGIARFDVVSKGKTVDQLTTYVMKPRKLVVALWLVGDTSRRLNLMQRAIDATSVYFKRQANTSIKLASLKKVGLPKGVEGEINARRRKGESVSEMQQIINTYALDSARLNVYLVREFVDRKTYGNSNAPVGRRSGGSIFIDDSAGFGRRFTLVLGHEIGHGLGLHHAEGSGHLMYSKGAAKKANKLGLQCDCDGKIGPLLSAVEMIQINSGQNLNKYSLGPAF